MQPQELTTQNHFTDQILKILTAENIKYLLTSKSTTPFENFLDPPMLLKSYYKAISLFFSVLHLHAGRI
jgi:hypothetical protein